MSHEFLESRNVFIDTSEFERLSFGFRSGSLKILTEHDQIKIVLADVVVSEVRDHLAKAANESVRLHKSFSDSARVLRTLGSDDFQALFQKFKADDVATALNVAFDEFLRVAEVETIPIPAAGSEEVFRRYFANEPPFGTGKKKAEFPDAFALDAVRCWAIDHQTKVYVVSRDQGMRDYCDTVDELIYVESIEQFLDMAVREDQEIADRVKAIMEADRSVFEDRLDQDFPMLGFFVEEREGTVESVTVTGTEIHDFLIVELKDGVATVDVNVSVSFTADVSYDDLEHAPYDSETKSLVMVEQLSDEWEREFEGTVRMRLRIDSENPESFAIEEFEINGGEDIGMALDDGWPYK